MPECTPRIASLADIDEARDFEAGLASAIRIFVLEYLQAKCASEPNSGTD